MYLFSMVVLPSVMLECMAAAFTRRFLTRPAVAFRTCSVMAQRSGTAIRSTDEWLMSRSCHRAIPSVIGMT